jgi:hypothetical protein
MILYEGGALIFVFSSEPIYQCFFGFEAVIQVGSVARRVTVPIEIVLGKMIPQSLKSV